MLDLYCQGPRPSCNSEASLPAAIVTHNPPSPVTRLLNAILLANSLAVRWDPAKGSKGFAACRLQCVMEPLAAQPYAAALWLCATQTATDPTLEFESPMKQQLEPAPKHMNPLALRATGSSTARGYIEGSRSFCLRSPDKVGIRLAQYVHIYIYIYFQQGCLKVDPP